MNLMMEGKTLNQLEQHIDDVFKERGVMTESL